MSTRPSAKIFEDEMLYRNKRVKTTVADDSVNEAEDKEAYYDGHSEADFLQYNRKLTKKNDLARRFRIKTQLKWLFSFDFIFESTKIISLLLLGS